ncbi:MAG: methyl-accepting chemotaxis protein [Lachnospiraceae bacterium]|nr:methyl-accepting chemotaxis protein [Lachnospiraceae bacterium]
MYKQKLGSIDSKVKVSVIVFVSLAIVLILTIMGISIRKSTLESSQDALKIKAKDNAEIINDWIINQGFIAETLKNQIKNMDYEQPEEIVKVLADNKASNSDAMEYYICYDHDYEHVNADTGENQVGAAWTSGGADIPIDPTERPWYQSAVSAGYDSFALSDPYVDVVSGKVVVSLSKLVEIEGHEAVILFDIDTTTVLDKLNSIISNPSTESVFLTTAEGMVISHPNPEYLISGDTSTILTDKVKINLASTDVSKFKDYDGKTKYVAIGEVAHTGWKLCIAENISVISNKIRNMLIVPVILGIIIIVISIVYLSALLKKQLAPMNNMKKFINTNIVRDNSKKVFNNEVEEISYLIEVLQNSFIGTIKETRTKTDTIMGDMDSTTDLINVMSMSIVDVSDTIENVTEKTNSQTTSVENISKSTSEITEAISSLTEEASNMSVRSDEIRAKLKNIIPTIIKNKSNAVETINNSRSNLEKAIEESKIIEEIDKVSESIQGIAGQTNLLALNASIEAARAGEAGRGFAVVATEINQLSSDTSNEIDKVKNLTNRVTTAVNSLANESNKILKFLDEIVIKDYDRLESMSNSYREDSEYYSEVSSMLTEKTDRALKDISTVNDALMVISKTQESIFEAMQTASASTQELRASGEDIAGRAKGVLDVTENLKSTVGRFGL